VESEKGRLTVKYTQRLYNKKTSESIEVTRLGQTGVGPRQDVLNGVECALEYDKSICVRRRAAMRAVATVTVVAFLI